MGKYLYHRGIYWKMMSFAKLGEEHWCWWRMFETKCVGDKFEMLVTDIRKITNITSKVANMMILPPTSQIGHHHKVTNIAMSPTSLSSFKFKRYQEWFRRQHYKIVTIMKWVSPTSFFEKLQSLHRAKLFIMVQNYLETMGPIKLSVANSHSL